MWPPASSWVWRAWQVWDYPWRGQLILEQEPFSWYGTPHRTFHIAHDFRKMERWKQHARICLCTVYLTKSSTWFFGKLHPTYLCIFFLQKSCLSCSFLKMLNVNLFPLGSVFFLFSLPIFIFIQLVSCSCPLGDSPSPPPLQTIILKDIGIK